MTLEASNSAGTGTAMLDLEISPSAVVPVITSAATGSARVGSAFSYQITATGAPTSFYAYYLPDGLSLNVVSGVISGTPTMAGTFSAQIFAYDNTGWGEASLTLEVDPAAAGLPVATISATTPFVKVGSNDPGEFTISLSAAPSAKLTINYQIKGTAVDGRDYVFIPSSKKLKPGKTTKPIKIVPLGDLGGASQKTVKLVLLPGDGYTVGTTAPMKVKILGGP